MDVAILQPFVLPAKELRNCRRFWAQFWVPRQGSARCVVFVENCLLFHRVLSVRLWRLFIMNIVGCVFHLFVTTFDPYR